jgi:hypothetical protein
LLPSVTRAKKKSLTATYTAKAVISTDKCCYAHR